MQGDNSILVTTSKDNDELIRRGQELAQEIGCSFTLRQGQPLDYWFHSSKVECMVVIESQRIVVYSRNRQKYFFHPNMALHRARTLLKGGEDAMVKAMQLSPGQKVLDCTLGMGSDALIASLAVMEEGWVVGLEASPLIAVLIRRGILDYPWATIMGIGDRLREAGKRIKVINQDHEYFLRQAKDDSFDVVYFDPMFKETIWSAKGIDLLRCWGYHHTLKISTIKEAVRVARQRVVLKERNNSPEFVRLGFDCIIRGANRIAYGIIEKGSFDADYYT